MLIALINGDAVERTHVTLETGLVVRHSTRALP
jgi:LacI family transcriptional regulator